MHRRLWPMPPPMELGSCPSSRDLWNRNWLRSVQQRLSSCSRSDSGLTRIPIDDSSNEDDSTGFQKIKSPLRPVYPSEFGVIQSS